MLGNTAASFATDNHPLIGSWKLESFEYYGTWVSAEDTTSLKHFTKTHFTWVDVQDSNGVVKAVGGGRVSYENNYFIEHIDYGKGDSIEKLLGARVKFNWKIEDGVFHQTGVFPDGTTIYEKWVRVE